MDEQEITIDLHDLWNVWKKNLGLIKKVTAVCVVGAGVYLFLATPTYESSALLRVKQPQGLGSSLLDVLPAGNAANSKQLMSTYAEILKSRSVVVPVIKAGEEPDKNGDYPKYEGYVAGKITTKPFKDTEIMEVTVKAATAEQAQKINNLLVQGFLDRLTDLSRTEQRATKTFIEERVNTTKADLDKLESNLNEFKKEHNFLAPDNQTTLLEEKLGSIDKLRVENKVVLEAAVARHNVISKQLKNNTASIADNPIIAAYQQKLAELGAQRISYLEKYTDKHPNVIAVNQDIARVNSELNKEIDKIAAQKASSSNGVHQALLGDLFRSEAEVNVARANLNTVNNLENNFHDDIAKLSDVEKEYLALLRDVKVTQEIYEMLTKRLEEAKVAEAAVATDVQIVDTPSLPETPIAPKKGMTIMLAFFLGLLGSSGFVIVRELMNRTIKTSEDVENYLQLPVLGQIPSFDSLKNAEEEENLTIWQKIWRAVWKK